MTDRFPLRNHLFGFLSQCQPGDVRFVCNGSEPYYHLMGYVEFDPNILGIGGDDFNNGGITLTIVQGCMMSVPITPEQKPELQKLIAALPSATALPWYDFNTYIYFACWRDDKLCYFAYPRSKLPDQVKNLFKFFAPQSIEELEK